MADSRSKNATRNIVSAIVLKLYQNVISFVARTVFIYVLGTQYVGLNGLFSSILGVLNLAELGVGTALVFSMYKPIAEGDATTICALMNFYKKCYRAIGTVILIIGLALMPFLKYLVKSDLPAGINLYILYLLNLAGTVLSYFLFAYKNCLFNAHQRNDINNKISLAVGTVSTAIQLGTLVLYKNYYLYVIIALICGVVSNIITAIMANRIYPEYRSYGALDKERIKSIISRIKALFIVKVGNVVLYSFDNIVISAFLGLTALGLYSNYYHVVSSVVVIVGMLTTSIIATLGNSIVTESKQKNYNDFITLSFLNLWLVGWCAITLICLYQHFVRMWIGVENMLPIGMVLLFAAYFYTLQSNQIAGAYKDAAGIWESDRFRPAVTAGVNLVCNLIAVQFLGLYGIILSTVVSLLFVNTPWLIHNVCKLVFGKGVKEYTFLWARNLAVTVLAGLACYCLCRLLPEAGWGWFAVKAIVCLIVPNLIFLLCYFRTKGFDRGKTYVRKIARSLSRKAH